MSYPYADLGAFMGRENLDARVPVVYSKGGTVSPVIEAEVDTGATISVAPAGLAEDVGVRLTQGAPISLSGLAGTAQAYVHLLDLSIGGAFFPAIPVAILSDDSAPFLLGRLGFWQEASIIFDASGRQVTLTAVNPQEAPPLTGSLAPPPPGASAALGLLAIFAVAVGAYFLLSR